MQKKPESEIIKKEKEKEKWDNLDKNGEKESKISKKEKERE